MSETDMPCRTNLGMSCSISVVLPLPDHPANPKTFICAFYQPPPTAEFEADPGYSVSGGHSARPGKPRARRREDRPLHCPRARRIRHLERRARRAVRHRGLPRVDAGLAASLTGG